MAFAACCTLQCNLVAGLATGKKTPTAGDFMKPSLRAALAAPALLALSASLLATQTFAQSNAIERPVQAIAPDENGPIVVPKNAPVTVMTAPAIVAAPAIAGGRPYDSLIASHAASNGIPPELVHRVVMRESRYRAGAMGRGGTTGLMQIKLATARSMGYTGSAAGLLDPDTNLTYGVRYLAGAYRAAGGHHARAVGYYASGYRGASRPASAYARMKPEPSVFATAATGEPVIVGAREVQRKKR
jgi:soluble lytic murein transglycosylase-like protein